MNDAMPRNRYRAGDADRDRVLTALQEAYSEGRLDLEEMQERQERVLRSRYIDELPLVLEDLPQSSLVRAQPAASPQPVAPESEGDFSLAIMSGRAIRVARGTRAMSGFAWWGGNEIDLTDAMGPGSVVTLTLHAVMGGNRIRVPEGVRVVDQSLAIMAGNDIEKAQGDGSNGTLVLKGFLFWAGNEVKLCRPSSTP